MFALDTFSSALTAVHIGRKSVGHILFLEGEYTEKKKKTELKVFHVIHFVAADSLRYNGGKFFRELIHN